MFNYNVDNVSLQRPDFIKDLGVYFDPKLSFNKHIEMTIASAFRSLGFVIRNCKGFKNLSTLRLLYVTFVRSRLEYCFYCVESDLQLQYFTIGKNSA